MDLTPLYHLATLPPKMPQAEAISQEIVALREYFGGDVLYVNPNDECPLYVPRLLFGFHRLGELRSWEADLDLHHFYNPDPFPFPYLRRLRRPIVYSITCGVGDRRPNFAFFSSLAAIAVSDERSLRRLLSWGLENAVLVQPGIDLRCFTYSPLPLRSEIRLMVGSAPWTKGQFYTKGVDALLQAARQAPHLRLVFLWRGILADEMARRVGRMNLAGRVTVLNELVDVDAVLAGVHASITLATAPGIVKSYPHSLLESLAAGKPVIVSRAIPMADYVEQVGCGAVVERVATADILTAVESLTKEYSTLQSIAQQVGQRDFSQQQMLASYRRVYERVLGSTGR
ncbi:MAG: glycosyltransferase [Anaerolineae bacterium]|nr:glycosyltransferase [Anaerolineae bacterium]